MRPALLITVVVALAVVPAFSGRQAADPLVDLLARTRRAQTAMTQLTARFTETSVSPIVVDPIVATGTVTARRDPLHVVMRYEQPSARTVTMTDERLTVTWPDRADREDINIATIQNRVRRYFVDVSADDLRESFDITVTNDPAVSSGSVHLAMLPTRRQIREGLSRLDLWIDPSRLLLLRMYLAFPSGDTKTLDFRDFGVTPSPLDVPEHFALLERAGAGR